MNRSPRVILAKVGLDGHDVGVRLVAKGLVSAGFEVIYLGKRNRPQDIALAAIDEGASAIGVSCLSGGLGYLASQMVEILIERGTEIPVIAGGVDEPRELQRMRDAGVRYYFGPGSSVDDIVGAFKEAVKSVS